MIEKEKTPLIQSVKDSNDFRHDVTFFRKRFLISTAASTLLLMSMVTLLVTNTLDYRDTSEKTVAEDTVFLTMLLLTFAGFAGMVYYGVKMRLSEIALANYEDVNGQNSDLEFIDSGGPMSS